MIAARWNCDGTSKRCLNLNLFYWHIYRQACVHKGSNLELIYILYFTAGESHLKLIYPIKSTKHNFQFNLFKRNLSR